MEAKFEALYSNEPEAEVVIRVAMLEIAQLVIEALSELAKRVQPLAPYDVFLAHYDAEGGSIVFHGEQFLEVKDANNAIVDEGFSWLARLRVSNQVRDPAVLFAMTDKARSWRFSVGAAGRGLWVDLTLSHPDGRVEQIRSTLASLIEARLYEASFTLGARVAIAPEHSILQVRYGAYLQTESKGGGGDKLAPADYWSLGSDVDGMNGGAGSYQEIVMLRNPDPPIFNQAFEYLDLKYG